METFKVCSIDEFWEAMGNAGFYRVTPNQGVMGGKVFYCAEPPEQVTGFMESKINELKDLLRGYP